MQSGITYGIRPSGDELDHPSCVDPGGPVAERLLAAGFLEGAPNVHEGQGRANRRFAERGAGWSCRQPHGWLSGGRGER